jgi:hypothetical protein
LTGALVGDTVSYGSDGSGGTLISFNASATSANWLGTTSTNLSAPYYTTYYDWSTSSNWSNGVPVSSADVAINGSVNSPTLNSAATISSLTLNAGSLTVGSSGSLTVSNALTLSGYNSFNNFAGTMNVSSLVLANTGSYSSSNFNLSGGKVSASAITYTNNGNISLSGNGEFNFGTVTNTSSTTGSNLSLNINANNYNNPTTNGVQSTATLKVVGALNTLSQYSTYSVGSNTVLELQNTGTGNFSNNISFNGNNATLKLDTPNSFTGTISGFALTDKIDLVGMVASSVTYNNSTNVLTVNTGSGVRTFTLTGALVGDTVSYGSDGSGGTLISFNAANTTNVATFLANLSTYSSSNTAYISDSAANIFSNLDALQTNVSKIGSIVSSGGISPATITVSQLSNDASVLSLISGSFALSVTGVTVNNLSTVLGNKYVSTVSITDNGANILAALPLLEANYTKISAIQLSGGTSLTVTSAQATADADVISLIRAGGATVNIVSSNIPPYNTAIAKAFVLQGNASVDHWVITISVSTPAQGSVAASTQIITESIKQGSSGGNITFDPNFNGSLLPGSVFSLTAQGFNASGSVIASGQLAGNPPFFNPSATSSTTPNFSSSMNFKIISLANDGTVTGLPTSYSTALGAYVLTGTAGIGSQVSHAPYSLSALQTALQNNSVLAQLFANHQVLIADLNAVAGVVGFGNESPFINVSDYTVRDVNNLGSWNPIAISTPNAVTLKVWTSYNGSSYASNSTISLPAGISNNINAGNLGGNYTSTSSVTSTSAITLPASVTKFYFTDSNNSAISGLQMANVPVSGGIVNLIAAPSSSSNAVSVYNGTVAQILTAASSAPIGSLYYITDKILNIQAAGAQLYSLQINNQIIGATPTDGFAPIAMSSSGGYTPIGINDNNGNTSYIRVVNAGTWTGEKIHSPLAIKTTGSTQVTAYIDGVAVNTSTSTTINGVTYWTFPGGWSSSLTTLASATNHMHTLTFGAASTGVTVQVGVVPPGGGNPSSFSNSLSIWIGSAAQLPTSLSDVVANTFYIISDLSPNIVNLMGAGNQASTNNGVVDFLAAQGLLAYNPIYGLSWASLKQLEQNNNIPIANVSGLSIFDSAYVIERNIYDLEAGQSVYVRDNLPRILSAGFVSLANTVKSGGTIYTGSDGLKAVFNNNAGYSHIQWSGTFGELISLDNQTAVANVYNGNMKLQGIYVQDRVASFDAISSSLISNLSSFVTNNVYTSGQINIQLRDTVANIYSALAGSGASALEAKLGQIAALASSSMSSYSSVQVYDSVANLKVAYNNGQINTLQGISNSLLSGVSSTNHNVNLTIRVTDNIANIEALLNDSNYAPLVAYVGAFEVVDTAANIAADINSNNSWNSAVGYSNNIYVKDTFANIKSNANALFGNNSNQEVNKVFFTDIAGASASSPLVISSSYSAIAQLPIFDFSQATGFSGTVTATESILSSSAIPAGYSASSAISLTISDTSGHKVVIDVLMPSATITDPYNSDLLSILNWISI